MNLLPKPAFLIAGLCLFAGSFVSYAQESKPAPKDPAGSKNPAPPDAPKAQAEPEKPNLPAGVLARVNGRDITLDEYVHYLLASIGKTRLDEYVDRLLTDEEATKQGVSVTPDEVNASVDEAIDRTIKSYYQGKKERYDAELARQHKTLEDEKARRRQLRYYELLADRIILKTREANDAELQKQFERTYGEGGVQYTLRHILVSTRGDAKAPVKSSAEAKEKAEKILKEIQGGLDFVQAVKQYSEDLLTKANEGRIAQYRKGTYGENFHKAVMGLSKEHPLSGVVESNRGFHIIQLVDKQTVKIADVKAALEKEVKTRTPSVSERQALTKRLREKAKLEGL